MEWLAGFFTITVLKGVVIGLIILTPVCLYYRSRWKKDLAMFDSWAHRKEVEIAVFKKRYQTKEITIGEKKEILTTFDGGQRWYRTEERDDGLHIFTDVSEEAQAALPQAIVEQILEDRAIQRAKVFESALVW